MEQDYQEDTNRVSDDTYEQYEEVISLPGATCTIGQITKGEDRYGGIKEYHEMVSKGRYPKGYPEGAVVHWTSGRYEGDRHKNFINFMRRRHLGTLYIDREGKIFQDLRLHLKYWHSGLSRHPFYPGTTAIHNRAIGIECEGAGQVKPLPSGKGFYAWWDEDIKTGGPKKGATVIPESDVQFIQTGHNNIARGYYHKLTEKQIHALTCTLIWLYLNSPDVFDLAKVVGHDEICPGRKSDPGGALVIGGVPYTMDQYRKYVLNIASIHGISKKSLNEYYEAGLQEIK